MGDGGALGDRALLWEQLSRLIAKRSGPCNSAVFPRQSIFLAKSPRRLQRQSLCLQYDHLANIIHIQVAMRFFKVVAGKGVLW